jgi:hypothetical protein
MKVEPSLLQFLGVSTKNGTTSNNSKNVVENPKTQRKTRQFTKEQHQAASQHVQHTPKQTNTM